MTDRTVFKVSGQTTKWVHQEPGGMLLIDKIAGGDYKLSESELTQFARLTGSGETIETLAKRFGLFTPKQKTHDLIRWIYAEIRKPIPVEKIRDPNHLLPAVATLAGDPYALEIEDLVQLQNLLPRRNIWHVDVLREFHFYVRTDTKYVSDAFQVSLQAAIDLSPTAFSDQNIEKLSEVYPGKTRPPWGRSCSDFPG